MSYTEEPIASNIYDAIQFMKKELIRRQALIDASPLRFLKNWPTAIIYLSAFLLPIIIGMIWYQLTHGEAAFFGVLISFFGPIFSMIILSELDFMSHRKAHKTILKFLPDLEILVRRNPYLDVGFELHTAGVHTWFNESVMKAMLKKHAKDIKAARLARDEEHDGE